MSVSVWYRYKCEWTCVDEYHVDSVCVWGLGHQRGWGERKNEKGQTFGLCK